MAECNICQRRRGHIESRSAASLNRCLKVLSAADAIARAVPPHDSSDIRGRAQRLYVGLKAEKYSTKMEN